MVSFLIVVAVGGSRGIPGALFGALLLGVLDVAGKYYVPSIGAFIIYAVMVVDADHPAARPVRRGDGHERARRPGDARSRRISAATTRWRPREIVFWLGDRSR